MIKEGFSSEGDRILSDGTRGKLGITNLYNDKNTKIVTDTKPLPAVHLSLDELEKVEQLLRKNTTGSKVEVTLSLPGGVDHHYNSVRQIDPSLLASVGGSNSYSISVIGEEGKCTIAGESSATESHIIYCSGEDSWNSQIKLDVIEFLESVQTDKSHLRSILTGRKSTVAAVIAAFFVGWALTAVAPQSVVHYYPNLTDAIIFTLGSFGLMIVRFRNWIHPLVKISDVHSHPTGDRIYKMAVTAVLLTTVIILVRSALEGGPTIRLEF